MINNIESYSKKDLIELAETHVKEYQELHRENEQLKAAINSHNKECEDLCQPEQCGYAKYKRDCPNCPKDWKIEDERKEIGMTNTVNQRVVCAAVRDTLSGVVVIGVRHFCPIMNANIDAIRLVVDTEFVNPEQGFIDQRGEFLTREEAHIVAKRERQIVRRVGGDSTELYSENLY